MKLFTRLSIPFYFGATVILLGAGAVVEIIKEYYPIVRGTIISFIQKTYKSYNSSRSSHPYGRLPAV